MTNNMVSKNRSSIDFKVFQIQNTCFHNAIYKICNTRFMNIIFTFVLDFPYKIHGKVRVRVVTESVAVPSLATEFSITPPIYRIA